jgi:hypothetical protein
MDSSVLLRAFQSCIFFPGVRGRRDLRGLQSSRHQWNILLIRLNFSVSCHPGHANDRNETHTQKSKKAKKKKIKTPKTLQKKVKYTKH